MNFTTHWLMTVGALYVFLLCGIGARYLDKRQKRRRQ